MLGAVIDLGECLDLMSEKSIDLVRTYHAQLRSVFRTAQAPMPKNEKGTDLLLRRLDCAVINYMHYSLKESDKSPYDTVKGVFIEGSRIYENSGFYEKTHVQICVRNADCIKGVFRVPQSHLI